MRRALAADAELMDDADDVTAADGDAAQAELLRELASSSVVEDFRLRELGAFTAELVERAARAD